MLAEDRVADVVGLVEAAEALSWDLALCALDGHGGRQAEGVVVLCIVGLSRWRVGGLGSRRRDANAEPNRGRGKLSASGGCDGRAGEGAATVDLLKDAVGDEAVVAERLEVLRLLLGAV